jgi:hypothetical protein
MPSSKVLGKFKKGKLHSGSKAGPKVKNRQQAIAIMLSEKRKEDKQGGKYHAKKRPRSKPKTSVSEALSS